MQGAKAMQGTKRKTTRKPRTGAVGKTKSPRATQTKAAKPKGGKAKVSTADLQLTFRTRTASDDDYIIQLTEEQLGSVHEQAFREPFPRAQFLNYLQSGAPTVIIQRGGKRIGYYSYLVSPDARMHVSALVIEKNHQKDGIGTTVMKQLEQEATQQGVRVMEVFVQQSNEASIAFTKKLGFQEAYRFPPNTICFQKMVGQAKATGGNPSHPGQPTQPPSLIPGQVPGAIPNQPPIFE